MGQFTLVFAPLRVPGECTVATDGGHLTLDNRPSQGATLCVGAGGDGGPELNLLLAGQAGVNRSPLLADGGFHFESPSVPVPATGTACGCDATDTETLDGFLLTGAADAGFALQPDGGLPLVNALSATLTDRLTVTSSQNCACSFPCTVNYILSGNRF